jgi:phosphomannomutase
MNKHTLEAVPAASAKELKTQKTAKAKRIVVGSDVHKNSYQVARKVDSGVVSAVANFRSQTELLLYIEKQLGQAEEVVVDLPSKTRTGYWLIID